MSINQSPEAAPCLPAGQAKLVTQLPALTLEGTDGTNGTDEERVREILCASIERLYHGGRLLRDELDRLTFTELRGVLRTLVNAEQEQRVEAYLTPDTAHLTPQMQEAA